MLVEPTEHAGGACHITICLLSSVVSLEDSGFFSCISAFDFDWLNFSVSAILGLSDTIAEEAEQGARTSESNLHSGSHGVGPVILKLRSTSPAITDNLSLIRNLPGEIMYKYNECNITQYQNQAGRHKKQKLKASIIHEEKHKNSKALKYLHIIFFLYRTVWFI